MIIHHGGSWVVSWLSPRDWRAEGFTGPWSHGFDWHTKSCWHVYLRLLGLEISVVR